MTLAQIVVIRKEIAKLESFIDGYKQSAKDVQNVHNFDVAIAAMERQLAELREGL